MNKKKERVEVANRYLYTIAKRCVNARVNGGEVLVHTSDGHCFYVVGFNNVKDFETIFPDAKERLYLKGDENGNTKVQDLNREQSEAGDGSDLGGGSESRRDSSDGDSKLEGV